MEGNERYFKQGDRVRVVTTHRWMPGRPGIIKRVEPRVGNRFLVKFNRDELGLWHDDEGDPVLRLSADDLAPAAEDYSLEAAPSLATGHGAF